MPVGVNVCSCWEKKESLLDILAKIKTEESEMKKVAK